MDVKACVCYGYKKPFCNLSDEDEQSLSKKGITYARSETDKYLCVEETKQNFDWNSGNVILNTQFIKTDFLLRNGWDEKLRDACKIINLEWNASLAGWLVICDYLDRG